MPFKTFTALDVLTAAELNDYLMEQAVITCTSGARPTGVQGMMIYETNTDTIRVYDGASWLAIWRKPATYTPTLVGMAVGTGGSAENSGQFTFAGGVLSVSGRIVFGTSGTTFPAATISASLPSGFTATNSSNDRPIGICEMNDSGTRWLGTCVLSSSTTVRFFALGANLTYGTSTATSTTVPFTWAAGDYIAWNISVSAVLS